MVFSFKFFFQQYQSCLFNGESVWSLLGMLSSCLRYDSDVGGDGKENWDQDIHIHNQRTAMGVSRGKDHLLQLHIISMFLTNS